MLLNPSSSEKEKLSSGVIVAVIVSTSIFLLVGLAVLYLKLTKSNFSHHIKTDEATKISSSGGSTGLLNFARCSSLLQERMGLGRNPSMNENAKRCITISKDIMSDVLYFERPVKFNFDEINNATNNFSSKILGQGSYGTVYHGMLRDQDVSIKEIGARKTPEFVAEIKSLCKLHHANLVELIGYSSNENDVYLVYEYVENGALDDHLHHFLEKGLTPLTWNSRMQIALDAARGLEYIHEHTKVHYVHCAVKTSNILLDSYFRAKVADFGLQKLMEMTKQFEALDICVVEKRVSDTSKCHQTGLLSTKSDVYSFGMVLIELITGQKAVSKVLAAFEDRLSPMHTKILHELADLSLLNVYPNHLFYKVCELAKQCLQKDAKCRPDMREIVYCLSQIALQSIEWEATLSGGSQIFSRITQGR